MRVVAALLLALAALLPRATEAGEYRLGVQDRLRVQVYEYPNLDGEYLVGASGTVPVPLAGEVRAEGATPAELAARIADAVAGATDGGAKVSVTVEVVGYRPFFVMGDVQNPGPYAFQPGLRMLQALALAGGVYRIADLGLLRVSRDALAAEGEIAALEVRERGLLLERERLEAELKGDAELRFADGAAGGPAGQAARERQRAVFATRREALDRQAGTLDALIGSLGDEVAALDRQSALKSRQIETVEQELGTARRLIGQGLAPTARGLELERLAADIEGDRQEVATQRLQARQALARTEQARFGLADDRRAEAAAGLRDLDERLDETRAALRTQRGLLDEARAAAPALRGLADGSPPALAYSVVRFAGGTAEHIDAGEGDAVEPGDVVTVRVLPAPEVRQEAAR